MREKFSLKYIGLGILTVFSAFYLLCLHLPRTLYSGLHLDESLYAGAASHILHGDLFLRHFWVEKPPLTFFMMALGILGVGENGFGFHLAGAVCATLSFFFLLKFLGSIVERKLFPLVLLVLTASFSVPYFIIHAGSAFNEPYQLLFLALFLFYCWKASAPDYLKDEKGWVWKAHVLFVVAMLCKQTTILWIPVLVLFWRLQSLKTASQWNGLTWREFSSLFFKQTKWLWFAFLFFCLTYKQKFSPIATFQMNAKGKSPAYTPGLLWERLNQWWTECSLAIGSPSALFILICLLGLLSFRAVKSSNKRYLYLFVIPFWLHVAVLVFSPCRIYARYLVILLPQGLALLFSGLALDSLSPVWLRRATAVVLASFSFLLIYQSLNRPPVHLDPWAGLATRQFASAVHQMREEIPKGSFVHTDTFWSLQPYQGGSRVHLSCDHPDCVRGEPEGVDKQFAFRQYLLLVQDTNRASERSSVLFTKESTEDDFKTCKLNLEVLNNQEIWRERLRFKPLKVTTEVLDDPTPREREKSLTGLWKVVPGVAKQVRFTFQNSSWIKTVTLWGKVTISRHYLPEIPVGPPRNQLGFRVERIQINDWNYDFVDLAPLVWKGFFVPFTSVSCTP